MPVNPSVTNANTFAKAICNPTFQEQEHFIEPEFTAERL